MYILYQGEVKVYVDGDKLVTQLKENKVLGERALDTEEKRMATIVSSKPCICLVLLKKDYLDVLFHVN